MAEIELPELPDHVQDMIGKSLIEEEGQFPVEQSYIWTSCSVVEDGNPIYWDEAAAKDITNGASAPPAMLSVWMRPHFWVPGQTEQHLPLQVHFTLKKELELPEAIITKNGVVFGTPVRIGDRISCKQKLRSISDPKTNKLGTGRYWIIDVEFYNQDGEFLGSEWYNCFGYRRKQ